MAHQTEEWRDIPGYRAYQVSSLGRVRSLPRVLSDGRRAGGVILKPSIDAKGYHRVSLRSNGRSKTIRVHVLVAEAFLGPRPEGMQILHRNDDHSRNDRRSLKYGTDIENKQERRKREEKEKKRNRKRSSKNKQEHRRQVQLVVSAELTPESGSEAAA